MPNGTYFTRTYEKAPEGAFSYVRVRRIELPTTAWKAVVLPLNYTRKRGTKRKLVFFYVSSAAGESFAYTSRHSPTPHSLFHQTAEQFSTDDSTTKRDICNPVAASYSTCDVIRTGLKTCLTSKTGNFQFWCINGLYRKLVLNKKYS